MLLNYLKLAWRNLLKNRFFSVLNIVGLSIGIACFLLIGRYVTDELSYDRFHPHASRIYRVNADILFGGNTLNLAVTADPMGAALKKDYPEVENYTRLYTSNGSKMVKKGDVFIVENNVAHADSTFFDVFAYPLTEGVARQALTAPNSVVISQSAARKYFGTDQVLGRTLETDDNEKTIYKITGVMADMPENAHFKFDFLFSMANVDYNFGTYTSHNFATYLLLKQGTNPKAFEKHFPEFIVKYVLPEAGQYMNIKSIEEFEQAGNKLTYSLIPVTDIHLHSSRMAEIRVNGSMQYVYIFSAVAFFLLLIACVNFMNLSTARSANRAREVGIRKVMGSEKSSLVKQFLTESTLVALISLLVALVLAALALPAFNQLAEKTYAFHSFFTPGWLLFLLLLPLFIGGLAGLYPSFYLSSFNPIRVLKGKINAGAKSSGLRSVLVVFQFATSIVLIAGTMVVYRQLKYIQEKNAGFNKDQVLVVNNTFPLGANFQAFLREVEKIPGVTGSTRAGYLPVVPSSRSDRTYATEATRTTQNSISMQHWKIDENYIPLMGMELIKGRNFSKEYGTDSTAMIINETVAQLLGPGDPIGKKIYTNDGGPNTTVAYTVIGVVKNFNYNSMREKIGPLCFELGNANWAAAFKVKGANAAPVMKAVQQIWREMAPSVPFEYKFLDETFNQMYKAEQRAGRITLVFSLLAIFVACLGLFGLASYMAEQRTKEIGVRKVLGADVPNIVAMLSKDFLRLVLVAAVIGIPLAWLGMSRWLQDFAYRSTLPAWVFLAATVLALLIALLTVSFQAIRAALANPVNSLRSE